mgnify:CR=1 FL=1
MKVLLKNEGQSIVEYDCIRRLIRLVKVENKRVYIVTHPTTSNILEIMDTKGGCPTIIKVESVESSVVVESTNGWNFSSRCCLLFLSTIPTESRFTKR